MMMSVLRKSTVRPCPSVSRPSSSTCRSTLKTSGCAFSISSKRIDLIGPPADRLGQRPALLVADIAGRRADQPRDGVLLHVFRHVEADHRGLVVEEERGERLGELGLADAGRAQEHERADRPVRILQAGARAADGGRDRLHRLAPGRRRACRARPPCAEACRARLRASCRPGMPVQRDTMCAMCCGVTSSSTRPPAARPAASASRSFFSSSGMTP